MLSRLTVEPLQYFLSGFDAVVLGFLENRNAAKVGVGEEDSVIEAGQAPPFFGENRTDGGADHGVAHAHDVDARDAPADVGVDALEVVEDGFFPVGPVFLEEKLAVLRRRAFGESPVKRPDGAVHVGTEALVHGVHVAKRGGIEEDGVPGRIGAAGFWIAIEGEIGGEPRGIDKIVEARKIFEEIRRKEGGRGEDDEFGLKLGVAGEDADAAARLGDAVDHLAGADVCADAFEEAASNPAVAFGPGERAFFLGLAGRKIVNAGPGGSAARERAVIVAAGVVHIPVQQAGIETALAKPAGKRDAIEILKF